MTKPVIAQVAFNAPLRRLFDYKLPADFPVDVIGRRVKAPFGRRDIIGLVMNTAATSTFANNKLKTLERVYDDMPPLPPSLLKLIRFCAEYYHCPIGIAAAAVLPAFFRRANVYSPPTVYRLSGANDENNAPLRGKIAPALLALFRERGALPLSEIREHIPSPQAALKRLVELKQVERCHLWEVPPPQLTAAAAAASAAAATPPVLTKAQEQAIAGLQLHDGFIPHLLFGATGSGKTEVYLQAAARVLAEGRQVLILTPEIHLTPQLESVFRARFPACRLAVLHSRLSDGERAHRWLMAQQGAADIVLGTRLAVFTPLPKLGLVVVDEEHDDSYKQDSGLPFSARNVAVWRAKNENVPIVTGSATPSLESYQNAAIEKWKLLLLPGHIHDRPPSFQIITVNEGDSIYHGMSDEFLRVLRDRLNAGQQALIFINRRGYAAGLCCRSCTAPRLCTRCSTTMTVYRRRDVLCCHLCGAIEAIPPACESCGGALVSFGVGTQRVEEAFARLFPDVKQLRLDSDAMGGGRFAAAREAIASGALPLLVGTQIIAKGHNFPHLSLIGVLNADQGLAAADFRAEERLFALLSQVVGRGTRNPNGCHVLLQTRHPKHPFYAELSADNVQDCWQRLLEERRRAQMPPFAHLALLTAKHTSPVLLEQFMEKVVNTGKALASGGVRVFDSVPPPIEKINDWHRRQVLVHSLARRPLHRFLDKWIETIPAGASWLMEVDPTIV